MRRFFQKSGAVLSALALWLGVMPSGARAATIGSLYTFTNALPTGVDGGTPVGGLIQASNGVLYGTTVNGGTNSPSSGEGSIFKITTNGVFTPLYTLTGNANGANPYAGVTQGTNGSFYGTAFQGGTNGYGSVFKLTATGTFSELWAFSSLKFHSGLPNFTNSDGANPIAPLVQGTNGNLYGTAPAGGTNGYGAIFAITNTGALIRLHSFTNGSDGAYPGALFQSGNGVLYGTATNGGAGYGTIFKMTGAGLLTPLYAFTNGVDGAYPGPALVQGTNGVLYGTTSGGGTNSTGVIFQITTNGIFTSLYSFAPRLLTIQTLTNADGLDAGPLVCGTDGNLYGFATFGGLNGTGTLFEFSPLGGLTVLYTFFTGPALGNGLFSNPLGANPTGLMQGRDGSFYGTAKNGGSNGFGVVFQVGTPPQITIQPVDNSVSLGATATFTVGATIPFCQWQFNGANLPNATNLTLTNLNVQITNAGPYQAVVSNIFGCVTSSVANLNITNVPVSFATDAAHLQFNAGQFTLVLTNLTGQGAVVLDFSPDLISWSPLITNPPAFGQFEYIDDHAGEHPSGYYRARVVPSP